MLKGTKNRNAILPYFCLLLLIIPFLPSVGEVMGSLVVAGGRSRSSGGGEELDIDTLDQEQEVAVTSVEVCTLILPVLLLHTAIHHSSQTTPFTDQPLELRNQ